MAFKDFKVDRKPPGKNVEPVTIVKCSSGRALSMTAELAKQTGLTEDFRATLQIGEGTDLGSFAVLPGGKRKVQSSNALRVMVTVTGILNSMGMKDGYQTAPMYEAREGMLVVWPGVSGVSEEAPADEPEEDPEP